jgi:hypothetical protein
MVKFQRVLVTTLIILSVALLFSKAYALSEYGLRCDDNKKCVSCKNDIKCIKCMHKCANAYGPADTDIKKSRSFGKAEACAQTRSKWCNAQCWDTDDVKNPEYVSTKPGCDKSSFYFPEGGTRHRD